MWYTLTSWQTSSVSCKVKLFGVWPSRRTFAQTWKFFGICLFIKGMTLWVLLVSNLRVTVVLVTELELGVGRCWASVPAQLCQPALLSVQSFLLFQQGSQIAQYEYLFVYFNKTSHAGAWSKRWAGALRTKRPLDLCNGGCLKLLASFLHTWHVSLEQWLRMHGWSLKVEK